MVAERSPNCIVVLIFGSREGVPPEVVRAYVRLLPRHAVVMTGGARGVDMVATETAMEMWSRGELAGVEVYPAQWDALGKSAGPERNKRLAKLAGHGVGFRCRGVSRGTDGMFDLLGDSGKTAALYVHPVGFGLSDPVGFGLGRQKL